MIKPAWKEPWNNLTLQPAMSHVLSCFCAAAAIKAGLATSAAHENTIKTTAQGFRGARRTISKRNVQIIAQDKMTTDYSFSIDLTGKHSQLVNLRKEIN